MEINCDESNVCEVIRALILSGPVPITIKMDNGVEFTLSGKDAAPSTEKTKFAIITCQAELMEYQKDGWEIDPVFMIENKGIVQTNDLYLLKKTEQADTNNKIG